MYAKILIVDNENALESIISPKFKNNIGTQKIEFIFVGNGGEALEKLQTESPIDIVITDLDRAELDGLVLLEKVQAINPNIKTIVISAYSDMDKIRLAMNRGAFDVLNKPIDLADLEVTIERTLHQVKKNKEASTFKPENSKNTPPSERQEPERSEQLEKISQELQQIKDRLIQSEKMSSLGQLLAGIAHDINNPVNFISGNISHADEYTQDLLNLVQLYQQQYPDRTPEIQDEEEDIELDFLIEDLPKILSSMKVGVERIRQIVLSLRNFSRSDETDMKAIDIHEGIDITLMILNNRLKAKSDHPEIQVIKEYGDLPEVECYFGQINQVFMNLLANAIDAIEEYNYQRTPAEVQTNPCNIRIRTEKIDRNRVRIGIIDNGPGMPPEVLDRAFEPFFTTKQNGKGTGLGLSISNSIIVDKHNGELNCISTPGKGAEFTIEIPINQSSEAKATA